MRNNRILVVDDEASITQALKLILEEQGAKVTTASSLNEAINLLARRTFNLVLTDLILPDGNGTALIERIKKDTPETEVILMTAQGSLDIAIEAIKKGAYYYLEKPFAPGQVVMIVERAMQMEQLRTENQALKRSFSSVIEKLGVVWQSPKLAQIREIIRTAGPSDATVLIEGESGTGKELIATAFHLASPRAEKPFIRINCAAIPHDLIESELFGYKIRSVHRSRPGQTRSDRSGGGRKSASGRNRRNAGVSANQTAARASGKTFAAARRRSRNGR